MTQVEIGDLRHRITIQKKTITTDSMGGALETWKDIKTVWAAVTNLHGREYFAAAATQAENTVKFTIRYSPGLDTTMRILFRGKPYDITAIDNIKYQNRFIEIKALGVDP